MMTQQKAKEKRDSTISFRVSKSRREKITGPAGECGMSLSDYVLSRAYEYEPKVRLTMEQEAVREQLVIARSDYAKYTSMLNAMSLPTMPYRGFAKNAKRRTRISAATRTAYP